MEGLHNALSRMRSGVFEYRKMGWWPRKDRVAATMPSVAVRMALAGQCFSNYMETYISIFPLLKPEAHWRGLKTRKGQMLAEGHHPEAVSLWLPVISFTHNDTKAIFVF